MEFYDFADNITAYPGEYLLHIPSRQIVVCGAFKLEERKIKALSNGVLIEDRIENFQKIKLNKEERRQKVVNRGCGGCKKK
jgi:hypothetical protein